MSTAERDADCTLAVDEDAVVEWFGRNGTASGRDRVVRAFPPFVGEIEGEIYQRGAREVYQGASPLLIRPREFVETHDIDHDVDWPDKVHAALKERLELHDPNAPDEEDDTLVVDVAYV